MLPCVSSSDRTLDSDDSDSSPPSPVQPLLDLSDESPSGEIVAGMAPEPAPGDNVLVAAMLQMEVNHSWQAF